MFEVNLPKLNFLYSFVMVIDNHGICSRNWFKKIQVGWEEISHRQVKGCINYALPSMFSSLTFSIAISMEQ